MFCSKCGTKVGNADAFCGKCGNKLTAVKKGSSKKEEAAAETKEQFDIKNLFSGRVSRRNYWLFFLMMFPINMALGFVPMGDFAASLFGIWIIAISFLGLSLVIRRFHDVNMSGWFVLLGFIPLFLLIILLLPPVDEGNKYGEYADRSFSFPLIFGLRGKM